MTDREWSIVTQQLPPERGHPGRPAHDNRVVLNGIVWRLRTGAPWRDMPDRYGRWNSIYRRYTRWQQAGIWRPVALLLLQMTVLTPNVYLRASLQGRDVRTPERAVAPRAASPNRPAAVAKRHAARRRALA